MEGLLYTDEWIGSGLTIGALEADLADEDADLGDADEGRKAGCEIIYTVIESLGGLRGGFLVGWWVGALPPGGVLNPPPPPRLLDSVKECVPCNP